nr:hyp [Cotesia vestalis bracovirus]
MTRIEDQPIIKIIYPFGCCSNRLARESNQIWHHC